MRKALIISSAICGSLFASAAAAQASDSAPTTPDQSAEASGQITDIVVTAQRRSESLQKAAIPVAVATGDELAKANISTPGQLGQLLPSLNSQNNGGGSATFFVRGVGTFTSSGYTDPAIAFNYDGVYIGRPTSTSGVFYDLQRVELLPGPQGTLYGRNATAGALNAIPVPPKLGELSGYGQFSYGNYDAVNMQGAINAPLSESAAVRLAGNLVRHDGYLSDGTSDQNDVALRGQILGKLSSELTVRLAADWSHQGGKGAGASYIAQYAYSPAAAGYVTTPAPLGRVVGLLDPRSQAYRRSQFVGLAGRNAGPLDNNVYLDNTNYGVNAELAWSTPYGTLTIIPAARAANLDNRFPTPAFIGYVQERDRQQSLETRFAGNRTGPFDYILGGYYYHETVQGNYTYSQDALAAYQNFKSNTYSYAAFARVTAHVSDRLRLVGGVRYTHDRKRFDGLSDAITVVCLARVGGVPSCPNAPVLPVTDEVAQLPFAAPTPNGPPSVLGTTGAIASDTRTRVNSGFSSSKATFHAGIEFDVAPASLLYASFENGYRSGGFSLAAGHETFRPEYIDAYTLGSKNRFLDGRLQLNVELFWWKYKDQQINHAGLDINGTPGAFTENVGNSRNRGAQVDLQARPLRDTVISANLQYLDAVYKTFVYAVPASNPPRYSGCIVLPTPGNAALADVDCSGKQAYNAPKWTLTMGAVQTLHGGGFDIVLSVNTQYKTKQVVGGDYLPLQIAPDFWSTNADFTLMRAASDRWSVALFARNLENNRIATSAPNFTLAGVITQVSTPPRTYGARLSFKF